MCYNLICILYALLCGQKIILEKKVGVTGSLLQAGSHMDPVVHLPKDEVANPRDRSLKARALLCLLTKLGNHLIHNIRLEIFNGQAPQHKLSSRRHHCP
jgi:hypothetical protein